MKFNLFIITPTGAARLALSSPYPSREATARTIRLSAASDREKPEDTAAFVQRVIHAPLGEPVTHEPTGISYRTEETA